MVQSVIQIKSGMRINVIASVKNIKLLIKLLNKQKKQLQQILMEKMQSVKEKNFYILLAF